MNPYKKLFNNSVIFALGNFGSKIINFLLVPLYTYYLTTAEYGVADLVTVTVSLLLPVVSVNVYEATLRFAIDKDRDLQKTLNNSLFIGALSSLLTILAFPIFQFFLEDQKLTIFMIVLLIIQLFRTILSQFSRGIGEIKTFALNGVLMTLITATSNIILLTVFDMGLSGYLLSMVLSNTLSIIYFTIRLNVFRYIDISSIDLTFTQSMLKYSIPMIPNNIMWWLINASNRYFILNFLGTSANGIYAISSRIPSVISIFSNIFMQAWQLSAIEEYENESDENFYTAVFNDYSSLLFIVSGAIIVVLKPTVSIFFSEEYFRSWESVPFLLLGVIFSALASFLGANYLATKETKGVFKTSVISGVSGVILNLILIPTLGLIGAGLSNMLSFFIMFVVRYIDTKKYIEVEVHWLKLILNIGIIILQIVVQFSDLSLRIELVVLLGLFFVQLLINYRLIFKTISIFLQFIKNKKK